MAFLWAKNDHGELEPREQDGDAAARRKKIRDPAAVGLVYNL